MVEIIQRAAAYSLTVNLMQEIGPAGQIIVKKSISEIFLALFAVAWHSIEKKIYP